MSVKNEMLLQELSELKYQTAELLAERLLVSEKTVRIRIGELNVLLKKHGAIISSKKGFGYKLEIVDREKYQSHTQKKTKYLPATSAERVPYILALLLNRADYIKIDDICDFLYVSRNTLIADLKKVEYILNMYSLNLERRPNYGIIISGSEFNKRICMANSLIKWNDFIMDDSKKQVDMHIIGDIILQVINEHKLRLSEISFDNMIVHMYIAVKRIKRNLSIDFDIKKAGEIIDKEMQAAAQSIASKIREHFGIDFQNDEIVYVAIHLRAKVSSDGMRKHEPNIVISRKIDELVLQMLYAVHESYGFDFQDNLELRMNLNQHMVPFDIRMEYGMPLENPILQQIKKEYALAYTIASGACTVLNRYYSKAIPEDELGYFAIIFALALEKQNKIIEKKNVIVVCVSGKGSSQLFLYKYRQAFGKYIDKIFECTVYELNDFDYNSNRIDYVFTTVPLNIKVPVPVFEVNLFMESKDIIAVNEVFEMGSSHFLHKYYKQELFITDLSCNTKQEVLLRFCEEAKKYYDIPENFFEAVMKREEMGQTDFGNLIAIPHPYKIMTKDHFVVVGILEKPIWWGHNEVSVVFLIALSMENDADIERFYQHTTNFLFDAKKIGLLIDNPDFEVLIQLLSSK